METEERKKLTDLVPSRACLQKLSDGDLDSLHAAHEVEITKITGQISISTNHRWAESAKQAKRILALHKAWIEREQRCREAAARKSSKEKNKLAAQEAVASSVAAKAERMRIASDEKIRQIDTFKEVCKQVVGDELYMHIWQLTYQRMEAKP